MLWWILSSILSALSTITWKKALDLSNVSSRYFNFLGMPIAIVIGVAYSLLGKVNFILPASTYGMIVLLSVFMVLSASMSQAIYKEEKISALLPFQKLSSIFTIAIAYLFFHDTSFVSFCIALTTILVVFGFSFDFRTWKPPKNLLLILSWNFLGAVRTLLLAYVITSVTSIGYFVLSSFLATAFLLALLLKDGAWREVRQGKKEFYLHRILSSLVWQTTVFISLFLLEKFGLIASTLLGFLSIGTTMFFGYLLLRDIPKRKDVVLAVAVSLMVFSGMYFRQ